VTTSEQINEIAAALAKAQGAMRPAVKDAINPAFGGKSRYADLAANVEAAREPLAANGLAVMQEPTIVERGVAVVTLLVHSSGQWIKFDPLTVPMSKSDAHGVGSATTYARRYALGAVLNLVAEDDDGNAATGQDKGARREPVPESKPEGYEDNLTTMESLTVPEARKAFANWPASHRDYFARVDKAKYEAFKAKGAKFDAEQRKGKTEAA
jgi:hypothetical protein